MSVDFARLRAAAVSRDARTTATFALPAAVLSRAKSVLAKLEAGRDATGGIAAGLDGLVARTIAANPDFAAARSRALAMRARIAPAGDAQYDITSNVAWDRIVVESDVVHVASRARALVFGSLALRSSS